MTVLIIVPKTAMGQFYYGTDTTIALKIDSLKVTIKFDDGASKADIITSIGRIVDEISDDHVVDGFVACSLYTPDGYGTFLDLLDTLGGIYLVEPYYLLPNDSSFLVGDRFCTSFDTSLSYL